MSDESHVLDEKVAEVLKNLEDGLKLMGWKMANDELAFREAIMKHPRHMVGEVVMAATFCISTQEDGTLHPYIALRAVEINGVNVNLFGDSPGENEDGLLYPEFTPYTAMGHHGAVDLLSFDAKHVENEYVTLDDLWFLVAYVRALAIRRTHPPFRRFRSAVELCSRYDESDALRALRHLGVFDVAIFAASGPD